MSATFSKTHAQIAGCFFILAAVTSIIGLKLYDPIITDSNFLINAREHYSHIVSGAIFELILVATATGTGIMFFPLLKRYNEHMGIGYLSFRVLEVVFIMIGTLSMLTALSISEHYAQGIVNNKETAQSLMVMLKSVHKWSFMLGPNFMLAINTFMYSFVFFRTGMIPGKLSQLGLSASLLIMIAAILEMFGFIEQLSIWGILLALPIALYEMSLATWLLWKGVKIID